ncbi:MAG: hypothetical protein HHJ09_08700 [Glaciimonas sp.]|nr:hypothetical protein [Glaciimonas sp.]
MNSSTLGRLARRRAELIARCTAQRDALSMQSQSLAQMMSTLDHGLALLQRIKNNPVAIASLVVGVAVIRPRRLLLLLRTGLLGWQALRAVAPLLHDMLERSKKKTGA